MNHWLIWVIAPTGILSTAVVFGTDMFFLTVGRPALRQASPIAATEVMGLFHMFAHTYADLGRPGDRIQQLAGADERRRTPLVLYNVAFDADPVHRFLYSFCEANQSDSN